MGEHAVMLKIWSDTNCQVVWRLFLLHSPALARLDKRLKHFSSHIFGELCEIAGIDISRLNEFVADIFGYHNGSVFSAELEISV